MDISETTDADLAEVVEIHRSAFGGDTEAELVRAILADATAQPALSLVARDGAAALGHVLFSRASLAGDADGPAMAILAPLAVIPAAQGKGVGSRLVEAGLQRLADAGNLCVFVLGDPAYYRRFGFVPATPQGLLAPYPLPPAYAEAWMVRSLGDGRGSGQGAVACCKALMRPELWIE